MQHNFAYFDNAATTFPKLPSVVQATTDFVTQFGVNAGRGQYDIAAIAAKMVKDTRGKLLELLHARPEHTVVFTPSATVALNMVLQGQRWKGGEVVYISHFEHNAVTRVLHALKERYNLQVRYLAMAGDSTEYDLDAIKKQFNEMQPNYVICSHASNVCGAIAPIADICAAAKEYGAVTIVDMAQSAGLLDISLTRLKVDFCVFAGHKTLLGLVGVGGFICRTGAPLDCILYGGTGVMSKEPTMPKEWPDRYEPGSSNTTAIASLNAAVDYIKGIGRESIEAAEQEI